jgi:hypothetical protein
LTRLCTHSTSAPACCPRPPIRTYTLAHPFDVRACMLSAPSRPHPHSRPVRALCVACAQTTSHSRSRPCPFPHDMCPCPFPHDMCPCPFPHDMCPCPFLHDMCPCPFLHNMCPCPFPHAPRIVPVGAQRTCMDSHLRLPIATSAGNSKKIIAVK